QRKRNINKAINFGVKVRFLEKDEFDLFLSLYRETEERAGFVSKTDEYFYNFIDNYGDKALLPLAYIDLDEYIINTQENINDKKQQKKVHKQINKLSMTKNNCYMTVS